ncbi:MAG TPA: flagellar filament capping protein FliD [Longimicrobiales bacterium]|nr:flagellar filament capping protein FliD [Longimicrobiales bacterium]
MATDPIASFSGLASGIQWRDLVDQIVQVERRRAVLVEAQVTKVQTRSAAWLTVQQKLGAVQAAVEGLADGSRFDVYATAIAGSGLRASASADASPGSYAVEVLSLAAAEKLGSDVVASSSEALGVSGQFWINGTGITVDAGDSLSEVAYAMNAANTGAAATRVTASVVGSGGGHQLVLTSQRTGAAGIDLVDGPDGVARALGFADTSTALKHATSDGGLSDAFMAKGTAVSTLLGITGAATGNVTLGPPGRTFVVAVDLADDLEEIAQAINDAAGLAGSSVSAAVVTDTVDGEVAYRLDISGTTTVVDANGVLEALGVVERGRSAVSQELTAGTALTAGGSPASASTDLTALDGGPQIGDTLTVAGTKRDGTAFSLTLTVDGVGDPAAGEVRTVGDLITALEGAGGFDDEARVEIGGDGKLVVTDLTGGSSRLALSIVANNQGGGTLDFGDFATTTVGRQRRIVAGADAAVRVDGVYATSTTNSISDVIPGVSLSVTAPTTEATVVTVSRNVDAVVSSVRTLVSAYNEVATFVTDQFTGGKGSSKPLAGDSTLRGMLSSLRSTVQTVLTTGVGGSWTRLGDLGITIQRDGTFELDESTLEAALESDPTAVRRLFGLHGSATGAGLRYVGSSDASVSGTYTVAVTSAAAQASAQGSANLADGFGAADDTLTITDLGTGKGYSVALTTGASAAAVLAAVQAELATPLAHTVASSAALTTDVGGTAATEDTTWGALFQAGVSAGVADGDVITVSGARADGTSFYETLTITDKDTQTLGQLKDLIQNAVGSDATVELGGDGKFLVTASATGSSLLELTLSADLAAGTLDLSTAVTREGRAAARIDASLVGGALRLVHQDYGSTVGFSIAYGNPGTDSELGFGASGTEFRGTDIAGTIAGLAAVGQGRILTGAEGGATEGIMVEIESTFTAGTVMFSRGIASLLDLALTPLLGTDEGSITAIMAALDDRVASLNDRVDEIDARLESRRSELIRRFTAMEQAMAKAQNQSAWLSSQIGTLAGWNSSGDS